MTAHQAYENLLRLFKETRVLESVAGLLGWDERTYLPGKGAAHRAEQMALLARLNHEQITAPRLGELLDQAAADTALAKRADSAVNLREIRRLRDRAVKMPARLVEELARTTTRAQGIWQEARKNDNFLAFAPWLDKIVALKREEAQAVGYQQSPYDALLDEYEPGATAAEVTLLFRALRAELAPLVAAIAQSGRQPRGDLWSHDYPIDRQHLFGQAAAAAIGFDFAAGRLDTTVHPFCSGLGPGDCRLTTRYHPHEWNQGFFGILHEAGHGLYEQGLDPEQFGTPLGMSVSLGIHESQSRLWENQVGRSKPFWQHFFPRLQQMFPGTLDDVSLDEFHFAINAVKPSFIRVEADEATYNLHIILRFELEQALVAGELKPADVPGAWNEQFRTLFALTPPSAALGCLQDIHWSMGGLGYFPTYTLGNLYSAQLMQAARRDLPGLDDDFRQGQFVRLKQWLNDKIHRQGQRYRPRELARRATGQELGHGPLLEYLKAKYEPLYGLK